MHELPRTPVNPAKHIENAKRSPSRRPFSWKAWHHPQLSSSLQSSLIPEGKYRPDDSDYVRNDHDLTESLVIMSRDFGERWSS
jgi:hypothetical protein